MKLFLTVEVNKAKIEAPLEEWREVYLKLKDLFHKETLLPFIPTNPYQDPYQYPIITYAKTGTPIPNSTVIIS